MWKRGAKKDLFFYLLYFFFFRQTAAAIIRQPLAKRILTPYPKINTAQCVGCGKCAESCPQHTITVREHKAHIEYSKCIHCFCCHEMCPKHVINIKRFSLFDL